MFFTEKGFRIDASKVALLANQIAVFTKLANPKLSKKPQFGNRPERFEKNYIV